MQPAATLIVIGATGDLTGRLLLPALARLSAAGELAENFAFLGAGPVDSTTRQFRDHAAAVLAAHAADLPSAERDIFLHRVDYRAVDVTDRTALADLLEPFTDAGVTALYLALPTNVVTTAVAVLESLSLPPTFRIAVEKPFGEDLTTARQLNAALHRINPDDHNVFRVDHVLGMPAVGLLPSLTAAVPPIPAGAAIDQVSILWQETLALEGRAAFYDRAGALKDLLQNHLLQILCMIILGDPAIARTGHLAERRLRALQAVQIPTAADAVAQSRRARYTAGRLADSGGASGELVPDYVAEAGVDAGRQTETLAEVVLRVASPRWSGTRFVLRAGKAMAQRRRGILVQYTAGPGQEAGASWIDVDRPSSDVSGGPDSAISQAGDSAPPEQIAYTRVLSSLLSGTFDLAVTAQEAERAWEIFMPFLTAWAAEQVPPTDYQAGTEDC